MSLDGRLNPNRDNPTHAHPALLTLTLRLWSYDEKLVTVTVLRSPQLFICAWYSVARHVFDRSVVLRLWVKVWTHAFPL